MAVAASVKRSWNSAACGCRSERAQRRQIQSKSYRGTTSCEWVETQKYVSKTLRTEFVRGATYSYSYSWMWGECEKWNENEHWAWISLTFGYGGVCCKAENRNKKKINKKKIKEEKKIYDKRKAIVSEKRPYTNEYTWCRKYKAIFGIYTSILDNAALEILRIFSSE